MNVRSGALIEGLDGAVNGTLEDRAVRFDDLRRAVLQSHGQRFGRDRDGKVGGAVGEEEERSTSVDPGQALATALSCRNESSQSPRTS